MKLPKHAPNNIHKLLDALCARSNKECTACEGCPFVRYGAGVENNSTKAQMFKHLNEYLAHLRMTS